MVRFHHPSSFEHDDNESKKQPYIPSSMGRLNREDPKPTKGSWVAETPVGDVHNSFMLVVIWF
jgi:hypothetical protein